MFKRKQQKMKQDLILGLGVLAFMGLLVIAGLVRDAFSGSSSSHK